MADDAVAPGELIDRACREYSAGVRCSQVDRPQVGENNVSVLLGRVRVHGAGASVHAMRR
jgi:hypothetical protein